MNKRGKEMISESEDLFKRINIVENILKGNQLQELPYLKHSNDERLEEYLKANKQKEEIAKKISYLLEQNDTYYIEICKLQRQIEQLSLKRDQNMKEMNLLKTNPFKIMEKKSQNELNVINRILEIKSEKINNCAIYKSKERKQNKKETTIRRKKNKISLKDQNTILAQSYKNQGIHQNRFYECLNDILITQLQRQYSNPLTIPAYCTCMKLKS
ncbi:hypothetical protein ABPG74_005764 [Tetrahymena malaccensis]